MKWWRIWPLFAFVFLVFGFIQIGNNHAEMIEQNAIRELKRMGARFEFEPYPLFSLRVGRSPKVVSVEAHGAQFSAHGLQLLGYLPGLQRLSLVNTPTTNDDLEYMTFLGDLRIVDLEETNVTDAGLKHFINMVWLEELRISGGRVTPDGLNELRRAMPGLVVVQAPGRQVPRP